MLREFILFGVVEIFILLMFYKKVGRIEEVKYWHIFILCPLFYFGGLPQLPFIKQIMMIIIMILYLKIIKRVSFKGILIIVLLSSMFLLITESVYFIILELCDIIDPTEINGYIKFLILLPIRVIQIITIQILGGSHGLDVVWKSIKTKK